ncbi:MAG TPA: MBL fold metallo-hydrolase [Anaerolineales bacterium]|nr:MBL fold metallo-hydrolase [Anaerolineales bacterium]
MKIRYLGHSCVEIIGIHHILIDPDFTHEPDPGVEYICITHAHRDHIGRVTEVASGRILASPDVCEIASKMGVSRERLQPVRPGQQIANIQILPGYSLIDDPIYTFFYLVFRRRKPDPGGTPLSFLVKDTANLLHIGDAHEAPLPVSPDILCLPWRKAPFQPNRYKKTLIDMANRFSPRYILPIHYDLAHSLADPGEIGGHTRAVLLNGNDWHRFANRKLAD